MTTEAHPGFTVKYAPPVPVPVPEGQYVIRAPLDQRGNPRHPAMHLSESEALDLHDKLHKALFGEEGP